MEFPSEHHEQAFYEMDAMLQIVCSVFEGYAYEYHIATAVIDLDFENGVVVLYAKEADESVGDKICSSVNSRFKGLKRDSIVTQDTQDHEIFYASLEGADGLDYKTCLDS